MRPGASRLRTEWDTRHPDSLRDWVRFAAASFFEAVPKALRRTSHLLNGAAAFELEA